MKMGFINASIKFLCSDEGTRTIVFGVSDFEDEEAMNFMAKQIAYAMKLCSPVFVLKNAGDWLVDPDELGVDQPIFLRPEKGRKKIVSTTIFNNKAYCLVVEYGYKQVTADEFDPQSLANWIDVIIK